jgi:hypothetical protein
LLRAQTQKFYSLSFVGQLTVCCGTPFTITNAIITIIIVDAIFDLIMFWLLCCCCCGAAWDENKSQTLYRLGGHCSVIMAERAKQLAYHYAIADQQLFILLLAVAAASYCKLDLEKSNYRAETSIRHLRF